VAATIDVRIPNIGDFHDVPVVDVLVKPGDTVRVEDPLVALESEKATMEVPSSHAGVVESIALKVGDKVSEGAIVLRLATADAALAAPADAPATPPVNAALPTPVSASATSTNGAAAAHQSVIDLVVPDIGDFTDIPVIEVLVAAGDRVERETALVTLESEKASMDVPSSAAGTIAEVLLKVGDRVSQGTPIARLAVTPTAAVEPAPAPAASAAPPPPASPASTQTQTVAAPASPPIAPSDPAPAQVVVHASPSIRRFARELGVDLRAVRGSGPRGRITREDVQGFVKTALAAPPAAPSSAASFAGLPPWPKIDFAKFGPIERVPLSRIQKLSGPNLHRNWVSIPHVTNNDEADVTELEAFRKKLNAENPSAKVTMLAFVIKAVVAALRAFPDMNASLDGDALVRKAYYHIGFAADTPGGLVVPVLKNADAKGILAIATETASLAAKAREGKLGPGDMQGATFTISSLGGIGGTSFTPIINAPEVGILGVSRSHIAPVWDGAAFSPRLMLPLSLSYDHRVIDGAQAARFNALLVATLGDLRRALL
jgi:pyruvate dehydrogenase E2 component (dihydrolipoamide acetyltransferase)